MRATWIIALAVAAFAPGPSAVAADDGRALLGEWSGEFVCNGLPRSATVIFADEADGRVRGEFSFLGPSNAGPPIGRFVVTAQTSPTGEFLVSPGRWMVQARGYPPLAFKVRRSPDGQRLSGSIDNVRCGAIDLAYKGRVDTVQLQPSSKPGLEPKGAARGRDDDSTSPPDCDALPTPGARSDCADKERYAPKIGGSSRQPGRFANPALIKACEFAYQAIDPVKAPECYSGLAALGRWKATVTSFAQEYASCEAFAGAFRGLVNRNFPLQAPSWRRYPALDCANVDKIFLARGLGSDATCARNSQDRVKELASCTGQAQGTPAFREAWLAALSQCRAGEQMPLYAAIKIHRSQRRLDDLFEFGCADVIEVVARHDLASAEQLAAARTDIAAAEAIRPPRESDIIAALKADLSSRFRCSDNRDLKIPEVFFRCTFAASMNSVERKHMDWLDDYMKGVLGGTDRVVTPPTVRLSLNDVVLHACEKTADGFHCRYDVGIGCRVNAIFERPEFDITGKMAEPSLCYALAGPRSRTELLRRAQSGFEIVKSR
ncbi:hypothetical protein [Bosea sp. BH3]|uniref:hypothetical protein n=1 Tax=Bosea sp. BH3 TaxID=2871701 RepID=UPI0021CAF112|nr:hypothetical protein [Bosea sp. BH3]MCU4178223.1 hypothetical protein [Bosea sp. BH3]